MASRHQEDSKAERMKRYMKKSIQEFLGVGEVGEKYAERWIARREQNARIIGNLKDVYPSPSVGIVSAVQRDSIKIKAPTSHALSVTQAGLKRRPPTKMSAPALTVMAVSKLMHGKTKEQKPSEEELKRSESASTLVLEFEADAVDSEFMREMFFDIDDADEVDSSPAHFRAEPQGDHIDAFIPLQRIKGAVSESLKYRTKRTFGILSILPKAYLRPKVRTSVFNDKAVKDQLEQMHDHRPFFTYWATFVQIVVFIVSVSVYGIAPFGIGREIQMEMVQMPNLVREYQSNIEQRNIWIGPRQADLIHLGAKYSPCMRPDQHLKESIRLDREEEKESACCIRNDGSGCVQRVKTKCSQLSTWNKWTVENPGPENRTSGSVCGEDPLYCQSQPSAPPYVWPDNILEWPICRDSPSNDISKSKGNRHMTCELLGRPCCHGIQGECIITTREHCDLKRGFFHQEAFLCSQVSCFEQICGMIPFSNKDTPDQFYRLWTSLFLHGGLIHLIVTVIFQLWIMRDMEKLVGAIRMAIIYIGSGIVGNLASCVFLPYQVEAGPSGSQFGVLACLLVEMLQSYQMYDRPAIAILKLVGPILVLFLFGLLPWFDNWAHLFGFLVGLFLAFALIPYVSFGKFDRHRKLISILISLGFVVGSFVLLIILFYVAPLMECAGCQYFNCIPFTAEFCDNMQVNLKKNSTYSSI